MKVACFDDKQDELLRAKKAVEDRGHECIVVQVGDAIPRNKLAERLKVIDEVDGVLTDLYFFPDCNPYREYETEPPAGLLIVIHTIARCKPVIICTDGDHHGAMAGWIYDAYLMSGGGNTQATSKAGVFELQDAKNWTEAIRMLEGAAQWLKEKQEKEAC